MFDLCCHLGPKGCLSGQAYKRQAGSGRAGLRAEAPGLEPHLVSTRWGSGGEGVFPKSFPSLYKLSFLSVESVRIK